MPIKGEATEIWFKQDTNEMAEEWLLEDLEPGARWAYMGLKAYIKVERPSQKRHSRAQRLGYRAAARRWNVRPEDVEAMESAAIAAGKLVIEGDEWVLTDITVCAHEDTAKRKAAREPQIPEDEREPEQTEANEDTADICAANGSKSEQTGAPCHATVTDTDTVIQPTVEEGGRSARKSDQALETAVQALGRTPVESDGDLYWHGANEPFRSVGLCLCVVHAETGAKPPTPKNVAAHAADHADLRQLVEALDGLDGRAGWEYASAMYLWAVKHSYAKSWTTINRSYIGYLEQMKNGVTSPKTKRAPAARESLAEQNERLEREMLADQLASGQITQEEYDFRAAA